MALTLSERLEHLLRRQIIWFEEALTWYANLETAFGTEAYDGMLEQLSTHGQAIADFTREREILEKELRASGAVSLPEALQPFAERASTLAKELGEVQTAAAARTLGVGQHIQAELGALQRGRNVLDGYRAGESEGVQWLDRKG